MSYFEKEAKARFREGQSLREIAASLNTDEPRIERALLGDHVVRVVTGVVQDMPALLSALPEVFTVHRVDDTICFDILPPPSTPRSVEWASETAHRLTERGFNAVVAPRWADAGV